MQADDSVLVDVADHSPGEQIVEEINVLDAKQNVTRASIVRSSDGTLNNAARNNTHEDREIFCPLARSHGGNDGS